MKKIFLLFFCLIISSMVFSLKDYRKYKDINYPNVKKIIDNSSDADIIKYFSSIVGKKIEWEGHVLFTKNIDATNDIIFVDIDRSTGNINKDKPDMMFYIDKKLGSRMDPYQKLYFIAVIEGYAEYENARYIKVKDIYLKGLMR